VVERAGHHVMEEEPEIIVSHMKDFFKVCNLNIKPTSNKSQTNSN
jgi:hypothetical protein